MFNRFGRVKLSGQKKRNSHGKFFLIQAAQMSWPFQIMLGYSTTITRLFLVRRSDAQRLRGVEKTTGQVGHWLLNMLHYIINMC